MVLAEKCSYIESFFTFNYFFLIIMQIGKWAVEAYEKSGMYVISTTKYAALA